MMELGFEGKREKVERDVNEFIGDFSLVAESVHSTREAVFNDGIDFDLQNKVSRLMKVFLSLYIYIYTHTLAKTLCLKAHT